MSACGLYADHSGHPPLCGKPATSLLRTACRCDPAHDSERPVCAGCKGALRARLDAGTVLRCSACWDSPRPHRCRVTLEWVPLEVSCT